MKGPERRRSRAESAASGHVVLLENGGKPRWQYPKANEKASIRDILNSDVGKPSRPKLCGNEDKASLTKSVAAGILPACPKLCEGGTGPGSSLPIAGSKETASGQAKPKGRTTGPAHENDRGGTIGPICRKSSTESVTASQTTLRTDSKAPGLAESNAEGGSPKLDIPHANMINSKRPMLREGRHKLV